MKIIRQVWENKGNGQLLISVPKKNSQKIKKGDFVEVRKIK